MWHEFGHAILGLQEEYQRVIDQILVFENLEEAHGKYNHHFFGG